MTAALFDLALRQVARDRGGAVARLRYNPAPARDVRVAVAARRTGAGVRVQAIGPDGNLQSGCGAEGLAAIARAAGCTSGDLGGGATALIEGGATLTALAGLATRWADPALSGRTDVVGGSALAGWWVERAAHPGTSAVADVLALSRARYVLGTVPGADDGAAWRRVFGAPVGLVGLVRWHEAITGGPLLAGLDMLREDDDWLLARYQEALAAGRSWEVPETLALAAMRLRSRCDAADTFAAALFGDPLWRARGVHTGHVCTGQVVIGAGSAGNRVTVEVGRLDTRLRAGSAVLGWVGDPLAAIPGSGGRLGGEVVATAVEAGALLVTIGALKRSDYRPGAGETVTVIPAPPSAATIRSNRVVVSRLYRQRYSWLSQGVTPAPVRRDVPLAVIIAAAENDNREDT
ncbi:hypothetical protein QDT91_29165 (plasmid) [Mycolicibacterium aubagnense]|uniref:hypothetical protein n=1 Tax=Mycolicibacterium aubagnense TaxID=319707 RepID=UPI00244E2403|nr:hypothetical protein [Mycolicibacterium aubagnense]WGI36090.1 hypothetical protein QDT91_29165 [Mycolicibacterium aubagnense]